MADHEGNELQGDGPEGGNDVEPVVPEGAADNMLEVASAQEGAGSVDGSFVSFDERAWLRKLRTFSGRRSPSAGELDYESWLYQVTQLKEVAIGGKTKCRLVIQSLAQPASGLARSLGSGVTLEKLIKVISTVYGSATDGHSLLMAVYDAVQRTEELSSAYLQRLQQLLRKAVDAGGLDESAEFDTLVKQFCRGCEDDTLLQTLCLPSGSHTYDDFCDLLMAVTVEEVRRREKSTRINRTRESASSDRSKAKHVGARSAVQVESGMGDVISALDAHTKAVVNEMAALKLDHQATTRKGPMLTSDATDKVPPRNLRPAYYFCFNCGLNNHMAYECTNPGNAQLVHQRLAKRQSGPGASGRGPGNGRGPGSQGQTQDPQT
jgi:hypothetical protein